MPYKLLIADDERDITDMLASYFRRRGCDVLTAYGGEEAIALSAREPDLILLDVSMPDVDGLEVCRRIRQDVACPILFLTARVEDGDKLRGFAAGGDEYIVKPFSIDVLGAQVEAHLRRDSRRAAPARLRFDGDLVINYSDRTLRFQGREIPLAKKEFDILAFLSQNPGLVFDKDRIYERVWSYDSEGTAPWWPSTSAASGGSWPPPGRSGTLRRSGGAATGGAGERTAVAGHGPAARLRSVRPGRLCRRHRAVHGPQPGPGQRAVEHPPAVP